MITRLLLSTGEVIYPNFLLKEEREVLRQKLNMPGITMQCACRTDRELFYGVSADLRIIPLHKHYEHAQWCSRCSGDKRNSACVYDEDGTATMYLKFNPLNFSIPKELKEEETLAEETDEGIEENSIEEEGIENEKEEPEKKGPCKERFPDYNLRNMVKSINHDTYAVRLMAGKYAYLSEEYFMNALIARLKSTYIHGMDKSLKDLSVSSDGIEFFYSKVSSLEESKLVLSVKDSVYGRFVFKPIMDKAKKEFLSFYGIEPEKYMQTRSLMAAGFTYKRLSRFGKEYKCVGRLCLFAVTKNGLYCDTLTERDTVERLMEQGKKCKGQFLYPDTDDSPMDGIFRIPKMGKEGYIYLYHKPKEPNTPYMYCNDTVPDENVIIEFIEEIKR